MSNEIIDFLYEVGQLKNVSRSGWLMVEAPKESVAQHSHRTAVIAHILAKLAKLPKEEELMLIKAALYHDLHEARIGDLHRIAKKYVSVDERKCEEHQIGSLPKDIREDIAACLELPKKLRVYLKDADKLECAIRAKEYLDLGYKTQTWISNTRKILKTKEAKSLLKKIEAQNSLEWLEDQRNRG